MKLVVMLALLFIGGTAHANNKEFGAFSDSAYSYCDAKILSTFWGEDTWEAKQRIGRKIGWGDQTILEGMLDQARTRARSRGETCQFWETDFTPSEANVLASYWGVTLSKAKAMVGQKMLTGGHQLVRSAIDAAGAATTQPGVAAVGFDKCHAKMLGHLWAMNPAESATRAQQKIASGYPAQIQAEIAEARRLGTVSARVRCSFWDTPYTYSDAEVLAQRWKVSVGQAKSHVELKYANGLESWLATEARAARGR